MIRNLVFDLGNVLVEFKPKDYIKSLGFNEEDATNLHKIIFKDKRWNEFDRGTITIDEYIEALKSENPEYIERIDMIFSKDWISNLLKPKLETIEFLEKMSKYYGIYVLSNISMCALEYLKTLDFWKDVDAGTYSYQIGYCKPESEIYEAFFEDNNLNPQECLFLDDLLPNIEAAEKAGMKGIVFKDNLDEVSEYLMKDKKLN